MQPPVPPEYRSPRSASRTQAPTTADQSRRSAATRAPVLGHRAALRYACSLQTAGSESDHPGWPVGQRLRLLAHEDHQAAETALSAAEAGSRLSGRGVTEAVRWREGPGW